MYQKTILREWLTLCQNIIQYFMALGSASAPGWMEIAFKYEENLPDRKVYTERFTQTITVLGEFL
jgi:hypothetical protein